MPSRDRAIRIPEDLAVVVRVQIDEAGSYVQTVGIDRSYGVPRAEMTDLRDQSSLDPDVGLVSRIPRAVEDHSVLDDQVKRWHRRPPEDGMIQRAAGCGALS